jgi:DNA-binding transcriptional regulator YhcF (GntR family)
MTRGQAVQFSVNRRIKMPVYVQLKEQIRHLIAVGELGPGTQLPPAERLADNLRINRHTVLKAYQELAQQGYVESRNGVGSFVRDAPGPAGAETLPAHVLPQLDVALQAALEQGMSPEQIAYLALTRAEALAARVVAAPPVTAALFECNAERLAYYARALGEALEIEVRPYLIADLDGAAAPAGLAEVDLAITPFFHLVEVRRKLRRDPELGRLELFAITVRPHLDVLRRLAELPEGSRLGILYFAGPHYTEERLRAMVEHIEQAHLRNLRAVEPIYVQDELRPELLRDLDAILVRPENLADTHKHVDLGVPIVEYHNVLDQASVAVLREVVREVRESKAARAARAPTPAADAPPVAAR